jgi:hypothetical protein
MALTHQPQLATTNEISSQIQAKLHRLEQLCPQAKETQQPRTRQDLPLSPTDDPANPYPLALKPGNIQSDSNNIHLTEIKHYVDIPATQQAEKARTTLSR